MERLGRDSAKTGQHAGFHVLAALLFLTLSLFVCRGLVGGTFPGGADAMGGVLETEMMKETGSYFSTWRAFTSVGHATSPAPVLSLARWLFTGVAGMSPATLEKAMLVGAVFLAGILMYWAALQLVGGSLAGVLAGLVYSLNPSFLSHIVDGHVSIALPYAVFPALLVVYKRAILDGRKSALVVLPIFLLMLGMLASPNYIMTALVFLWVVGVVMWIMRRIGTKRALLAAAASLLLLLQPLCATWGIGEARYTSAVGRSYAELYKNSNANTLGALGLEATENSTIARTAAGGWSWPGIPPTLARALALGMPLVAFAALLLKRERREEVVALAAAALVCVFLSKGPNGAFGSLYILLFDKVPLWDTMRVASRFGLMTATAFSLLTAHTMMAIDGTAWRRVGAGRAASAITALVVLVAVLVPSGAALTGVVEAFDVPSAYTEPYLWVSRQPGDSRVLNLPYRAMYYGSVVPRFDGFPAITTLDVGIYSPIFSKRDNAWGVETDEFWRFLGTSITSRAFGYRETSELLSAVGVQYVVAQVQALPEQVAAFASLEGVEEVFAGPGGGRVFEVPGHLPRVFGLDQLGVILGSEQAILPVLGMGLAHTSTTALTFLDQTRDQDERLRLIDCADLLFVQGSEYREHTVLLGDSAAVASRNETDLGEATGTVEGNGKPSPLEKLVYVVDGVDFAAAPLPEWFEQSAEEGKLEADSLFLTAPELRGASTVESDSDAFSGYARLGPVEGGSTVTGPYTKVLKRGGEYVARFRMKLCATPFGEVLGRVDVNDDGGSGVLASAVLRCSDFAAIGAYRTVDLIFVVPDEIKSGLEFRVWADRGAQIGVDYVYVEPVEHSYLARYVDFPFGGEYTVLVKSRSLPASAVGTSSVVLDGRECSSFVEVSPGLYRARFEVGNQGMHTFGVKFPFVYAVAIFRGSLLPLAPDGVAKEVVYERENTTRYNINAMEVTPSTIAVSETYHPYWDYAAGDGTVLHVPLYGLINGFVFTSSEFRGGIVQFGGNAIYAICIIGQCIAGLVVGHILLHHCRKSWSHRRPGEGTAGSRVGLARLAGSRIARGRPTT